MLCSYYDICLIIDIIVGKDQREIIYILHNIYRSAIIDSPSPGQEYYQTVQLKISTDWVSNTTTIWLMGWKQQELNQWSRSIIGTYHKLCRILMVDGWMKLCPIYLLNMQEYALESLVTG